MGPTNGFDRNWHVFLVVLQNCFPSSYFVILFDPNCTGQKKACVACCLCSKSPSLLETFGKMFTLFGMMIQIDELLFFAWIETPNQHVNGLV
jgi:hypothetical protein